MKEELAVALEKLGTDGIDAFYAYLILDYASLWILVGLCAWGIRTVWAKVKNDM